VFPFKSVSLLSEAILWKLRRWDWGYLQANMNLPNFRIGPRSWSVNQHSGPLLKKANPNFFCIFCKKSEAKSRDGIESNQKSNPDALNFDVCSLTRGSSLQLWKLSFQLTVLDTGYCIVTFQYILTKKSQHFRHSGAL